MKQQVAPLQANEVANIRKRTAAFDVRQHEFREEFRKIEPMMYSCTSVYDQIDEVQNTTVNHRPNCSSVLSVLTLSFSHVFVINA